MAQPLITVEYWRCLRDADGMVLFLLVEGHSSRHVIDARLHRIGSPMDIALTTRARLEESPAHVEVLINTEGLAPGQYDVTVTFDGEAVGTFPCEVGDPAAA